MPLPQIYLVRHGQTAWALTGQHTGRSDIPLTAVGEDQAREAGRRVAGETFSRVFSSPSQRARRTAELAGFGAQAEVDPDLAEWDYGDFEGLDTAQINARHPGWLVFRDGSPHGESVADMTARADRVVARLRTAGGSGDRILVFSSGHILRSIAARWLGVETAFGQYLSLDTASLSILSYEHSIDRPVISLWNELPGS